jgi:two-component system, NarL family, invasion response regulator UvrY
VITVLVADDHPIIRRGVKQIIADARDIEITGEAGNGQEVLQQIRKNKYDIILLDLSMPGISGMDVLKQIKKEKPDQAVLILSRYPEEQYAIPVLKAGASGYIAKTSIVEELVNAIRRVSHGHKYFSLSLAEKLLDLNNDPQKPLHELLSARELEVMCLIATGISISDIAKQLCLSPTTVSTYRSRVLKKMKISNDVGLVRYALENGLID